MAGRYLNFELQLESPAAQIYQVSVVNSPAGETLAPVTISFPFNDRDLERLRLKLENALLRSRTRSRRALSPEEETVRDFGRQLFDNIFIGDVRSLFYQSLREAEREELGLRLKLRLQPPEFAALPWEFLHEPREDSYICLSRNSPIVRYLELPRPIPPLRVAPPLRILGLVTSPSGLPPLDIALEKQHVERAIAPLQDLVELHWLEGETALDLQRALRRTQRSPWHIFHFVGHGSFDAQRDEGLIWLADRQGRAQALTATQLGGLLGDHRSLRLAVLNACEGARGSELDIFSSTAATLLRRGVPAVLAMQYEISDSAAVLLAEEFYSSLADGLPVDASLAEARKAISLTNAYSLEWGTPVLYMRARDGQIFNIDPATRLQPSLPLQKKSTEMVITEPEAEPALLRSALSVPQDHVAIPHIIPGKPPLHVKWCWVPGGAFTMGSNGYDDEKPVHQVTVDGFWLARYPLTNGQYRHFIEDGGYNERGWWTEAGWQWRQEQKVTQPAYWTDGKWNGETQPVVGVSWYEAYAFCRWAAEVTGEEIRLPTEAEWEKGARGTDSRTFPWGNTAPTDKLCNFNNNVGKTTSVGQYSPQGDSPYGCADMAGNVWEWCQSQYAAYPYEDDRRNEAEGSGSMVVRGGSWSRYADFVRSSARDRFGPVLRNINLGFRCASTPF